MRGRGQRIKDYTDIGEMPPEDLIDPNYVEPQQTYRPGFMDALSRIPGIGGLFGGDATYSGPEPDYSPVPENREMSGISRRPFDYTTWMNRILGAAELILGGYLVSISARSSAGGAAGIRDWNNYNQVHPILKGLGWSMNGIELASIDAIQHAIRSGELFETVKNYPAQTIMGTAFYVYDAFTTYYGLSELIEKDWLAAAAAASLLFATEMLWANGSQRISGLLDD